MQTLTFKVLFQKKGTASAILAIALLIALLTSINCLVNNISAQTTAIAQLSTASQTYIVTSKDATAISDSKINHQIIDQIKANSETKYANAQQHIKASISTTTQTYMVQVNGVDDIKTYLQNKHAYINGSASQKPNQANAGTILATIAGLNRNDNITLTVGDKTTQLTITGITRANQQLDNQLIIPLTTLQELTLNSQISIIEFTLKNPTKAQSVISNLTNTLPQNTKIVGTQPAAQFVSDINTQTVNFINVWSVAVYAVVLAAAYVTASRVVHEAESDLYTLRSLGVKKQTATNLVLAVTLTIALIGSIVGVSLGIVGTQAAASAVRWLMGNAQLAPFMEIQQALNTIFIAVSASLIGAAYPALKAVKTLGRTNPQ